MQEDLDDLKIAGAQEDCEALQASETVCSTCEYYIDCWEGSPWDAANQAYESSRGV